MFPLEGRVLTEFVDVCEVVDDDFAVEILDVDFSLFHVHHFFARHRLHAHHAAHDLRVGGKEIIIIIIIIVIIILISINACFIFSFVVMVIDKAFLRFIALEDRGMERRRQTDWQTD